jgi:pyruvate/2-oxoglutarate/acetoin dehydrogenase E1 component
MHYLDEINKKLLNFVKKKKKYIIYGQNIDTGTFISGLTKNFDKLNNNLIFNTPNCEYSLIGAGLGIMFDGGNVIYFGKQLDFILLGVDHFVNSINFLKNKLNKKKIGSYTIVLYVCDQGYQGPQSSFNNIDDLSSLAQIDTFQINTYFDVNTVIPYVFKKKGFNIISISQRNSKNIIFSEKPDSYSENMSFVKYFKGQDVVIISTNFSFQQALEIKESLKNNEKVSIINCNFLTELSYNFLIKNVRKSKKVLLISDGKSINHRIFKLESFIKSHASCAIKTKLLYREDFTWNIQLDKLEFGKSQLSEIKKFCEN